jgi:tetratricopeptide (TPR) repeat protein
MENSEKSELKRPEDTPMYRVMVDDNFHFMDESERYTLGEFKTLETAIAACRNFVDRDLDHFFKPGMTAKELYSYYTSFRCADAEPLYKRSLAIKEKVLGPDHPFVATALNDLAALHADQGHYADAEPLFKRSLAILEKALGPGHPDVAQSLSNLAELYRRQGRDTDAEPLFKRSLAIREKALGADHP